MNTILRNIEITIGALGLMYTVIMTGMHYTGAGTDIILLFSLIFLAHGIFRNAWNRLTGKHTWIKEMFRAAMSTAGLLILAVSLVMIFDLPGYGEGYSVIIPGSGVNDDGRPSVLSQSRVEAALPYIEGWKDATVFASGASYRNYGDSEAEAMQKELVRQGVDPWRIVMEDQSTSTEENMRNSAYLINLYNRDRNVMIATNEFHMYRCCWYARKYGLNPYRLTAKTPWVLLPELWMREIPAVLYAWFLS